MTASAQVVQYLLSMDLDPTKHNYKGRSPLEEAALAGNWKTMSVLLPWKSDETSYRTTPLGTCLVESGNLDAITAFIGHCGQQVIEHGQQPMLHVAVNMKSLAVIRLLLGYEGLDINGRDYEGRAVIHCAAKIGDTDMLRLLLAYPGIDVNAPRTTCTSPWKKSALFIAIRLGHEGAVRILLAHESIEFGGAYSWPANEIKYCMVHRRYRIGQIILEDDRVQKNQSVDPLLRAIMQAHEDEAIDLLQDFLISTYIPENNDMVHLHWAIALGRTAVAKRLMDVPAIDVNYSRCKFAPIEVAAATGDSDSLRLLLDHPRIEPRLGKSVYEAVKGGHLQALELLLLQPMIDPIESETLITAVKKDSAEMVKMLLDCPRTDVNQKKYDWSETALFGAVKRGNHDIIWLLLKHKGQTKVDINAVVLYFPEATALDIALR
ncbi:ankyrin [Karstenula rhodostoma CBS 690.94]|uniref:Ankyrin n=1 Tax=Karstenula rhodostoma CBS 690.94 TaxID=1392251 RepID=A0A9P4UHS6_9PLEO|nr:ankyrin [Karstenula rhodostoma CBS 690.94]